MNTDKLVVVVDMQNDFITGALGTPEAQEIVPGVVEYIKNFKGDVVATMDTHGADYMDTQEGKLLPVPHCIKDTEGWQLVDPIKSLLKYVKKIEKDTFGSCRLLSGLAGSTYEEIHFVGVCTGICVISNAVLAKSALPNAKIVIHKDLCACVTPQSHEQALQSMKTLQMFIE